MSGKELKGTRTRRNRHKSLVATNAEDFDVDGRVLPGYYVAHFNSPRRPTRKDENNSDNEEYNADDNCSSDDEAPMPRGSSQAGLMNQNSQTPEFLDSPPPQLVVHHQIPRGVSSATNPTPPQDDSQEAAFRTSMAFRTLTLSAAQSASPTTPAADTVADEAWNAPY
jgi:hypothetical protein